MLFKNLSIYKTSGDPSQKALDDFLTRYKFEPCLPTQESTAGFTTVFGLDSRVFSVNGCHLFCLKVDEKVIPPSAVRAESKVRKVERESALGRKLTSSERGEIEQQARQALCEVAFCRPADLWAYLDTKAGLLVINTTSAKTADGLAQTIKGCMPEKDMLPLTSSSDVQAIMTSWLRAGQASEPFALGHKCEITDGKGIIRYKERLLSDSKLQEYLIEGLKAETLSISLPGRVGFVLTTDFVIKEFVLDPDILDGLKVAGADPLEIVSNELREMSEQIRYLISECTKQFGLNR